MFKSNAPVSDNRNAIQELQPPTRILVIGAGYAGMLFTIRLAGKVSRQNVQISLVNETGTFTERLRLHQFATNHAVQWRSIPQMLRKTHVQFIQGRVTSIDTAHHEIVVKDQQQVHQLKYDYLVYALGSLTDRQAVPGVAEYAYTLAPNGPLSAAALREALPFVQIRHGQVMVCGGGATGIETAAEVATSYPNIKVRLVTQGSFGQFLGNTIATTISHSLTHMGVEIADHRPHVHAPANIQQRLLTGFLQAIQAGEMSTLMNLLAEDVTFWGDGGGKVKGAATRPISGRVTVARFFLQTGNVFRRSLPEDAWVELAEVNRQPALVIRSNERAISVLTIEVEDGYIQTIRVVANPDKLAHV